ncbi:MAG: hypothetical protein M1359_00365 [Betaproteobacteria bacterium]|nr:hypothetical protein [Comamonadaceae bacterium]MCL5967745.1 hypothetical protein [Betaproteobacteria bacterium]OYX54911.1 MAG: hypothetical protein B7Y96_08495 [Comamonadaceae bacterium 32-67-11]
MKPVVFKRLLAAALALAGVWLLLLRQPGVWPGADGWLLGALALACAALLLLAVLGIEPLAGAATQAVAQ